MTPFYSEWVSTIIAYVSREKHSIQVALTQYSSDTKQLKTLQMSEQESSTHSNTGEQRIKPSPAQGFNSLFLNNFINITESAIIS